MIFKHFLNYLKNCFFKTVLYLPRAEHQLINTISYFSKIHIPCRLCGERKEKFNLILRLGGSAEISRIYIQGWGVVQRYQEYIQGWGGAEKSKVYTLQRYRDYKILVCGKDFNLEILNRYSKTLYEILLKKTSIFWKSFFF